MTESLLTAPEAPVQAAGHWARVSRTTGLIGLTTAAAYGAADIEPGLASYAFDVGNLGFANAWLALASFAVAAGWLVLDTRVLGPWLGWWAVVAGVGLVLCRFHWTSEAWFAPYFLFWIWVIVVSVQLIRSRAILDGQRS